MTITVELPDDIAVHTEPGRETLEAVAIAGYRSGSLTEFQMAQMLGLARLEVDDFLVQHGVEEHAYGLDDLARDEKSIEEMRAERLLRQ